MNAATRRMLLVGWSVLAAALIGVILFALAGRLDLPMLWAYAGVFGAMMVTGMSVIDPGLLKERLRSGARKASE